MHSSLKLKRINLKFLRITHFIIGIFHVHIAYIYLRGFCELSGERARKNKRSYLTSLRVFPLC